MAFYILKLNGNTYASRDIYRAVFSRGEKAIMTGPGYTHICDDIVVPIATTEEKDALLKVQHTYQDLDATITQFKAKNSDTETVTVPPLTRKFKIGQVEFAKVKEILAPDVYRKLDRLPYICVCGRKYVALGKIMGGVSRPICIEEAK